MTAATEPVTKRKIEGEVQTFSINPEVEPRRYIVVNLPYEDVRKYFSVYKYSAGKRTGEQRETVESHARKLYNAMLNGTFTPTSFNASIRPKLHDVKLKDEGRIAVIEVSSDNPLAMVDGGHRSTSLDWLYDDDNAEIKANVAKLNVPIIIYLDGHGKTDFLNLQEGRKVDATHQLALRVETGEGLPEKDLEATQMAFGMAQLLNVKDSGSPFERFIRLDSRSEAPIPAKTLMAKGGDLGYSLIGLARVCIRLERDKKWGASMVVAAYQALEDKAKGLLETGKWLCPPPEGTKGGATMLVGLATMLAFRVGMRDDTEASEDDLKRLVKSAKEVFDTEVAGSMSNPDKRAKMGEFARSFFADLVSGVKPTFMEHEGIPTTLISMLGSSSLNVSKPAKPVAPPTTGKKRGRKPKTAAA